MLNNAFYSKSYTALVVRAERVTTKWGGYIRNGNKIHISVRFTSNVAGSMPVYNIPTDIAPAFGVPLIAVKSSDILNTNIKAVVDNDSGETYISVYNMDNNVEYVVNGEYVIG